MTQDQDQKQQRQESDATSSRLGLCHFRPDFCSLAMDLPSYVAPKVVAVEVAATDDVAVEGVSSVEVGSGAGTDISIGTADGTPNEGGDEDIAHKDGKEGDGPPAAASSVHGAQRADGDDESAGAEWVAGGQRKRELFAVARGVSYVQAFLPGNGIVEDADEEQMLPLRRLLPPLQLAFPTMLEVLVRLNLYQVL